LMNAGMYFAAPAIIIFKARKYIKIWNIVNLNWSIRSWNLLFSLLNSNQIE
jgi:hypothetical protein